MNIARDWTKAFNQCYQKKTCEYFYRISNLCVIGNTPALTWASLSFQGRPLEIIEIQILSKSNQATVQIFEEFEINELYLFSNVQRIQNH